MKRFEEFGFDTVLNRKGTNSVVCSGAKLMLFDGQAFGDAGRGFMRMNLACPRKTLSDAVKRLVNALTQAKESPPFIGIMDKPVPTFKCCGG